MRRTMKDFTWKLRKNQKTTTMNEVAGRNIIATTCQKTFKPQWKYYEKFGDAFRE
jgi:hypothetical protein